MINARLIGNDLTLNIVDILESLSGEQEKQLIEQLSCSDAIIEHVASQIVHGLTDEGYSGFIGSTMPQPSTPLGVAVRKVAMHAPELARKEIESLQRALARAEKSKSEYMNKYYALERKGRGY